MFHSKEKSSEKSIQGMLTENKH